MHGYILIQGDDVKARMWRDAAKTFGVEIQTAPGSAVYLPLRFLRHTLRRGRPKAVVFRYLNDYPQLWKTVCRAAAELLCVALCYLFRVRIVWICHNVDRESSCTFPLISRFRRSLIARRAAAILVTDDLLVDVARRYFPDRAARIETVQFGSYLRTTTGEETRQFTRHVTEIVARWRQEVAEQDRLLMVGLCAGSPALKMEHYARIPELIAAARRAGIELRMIVVGPIEDFLKATAPEALRFIQGDPRVSFTSGYVPIAEHEIAPFIDFYWRAYRDYSVPMSVYTAASVRKPILALNIGFLPKMVRAYRLGEVLEVDMSNIREALHRLRMWDAQNADRFLQMRSWTEGARRLAVACGYEIARAT
nr:MAG: hypothetical protein DIU57_16515 [Pseudomonadota bacterium]